MICNKNYYFYNMFQTSMTIRLEIIADAEDPRLIIQGELNSINDFCNDFVRSMFL